MATHRINIMSNLALDSGVFPDLVSNQITEAAAPSVGGQNCFVLADGGSDEGLQGSFKVPKNYVGAPALVLTGILDGAPGASDVLGFGFRKRAVAHGESADGTLDAEQIASATIGSSGDGHADEDEIEEVITLTAGDYAVDDTVHWYAFIEAGSTTYTGNFLLTAVEFEYADA
jgi:hypothetical protein